MDDISLILNSPITEEQWDDITDVDFESTNIIKFLTKHDKEVEFIKLHRGRWVEVGGYCTPGGDPVWCCSECGKGIHVYGIEHGTYGADIADHQWVTCPNCGAVMTYEMRYL